MPLRQHAAVLLVTACLLLTGCSSDPPPPPELTPQAAISQIFERWSREELSHFTVTFHSDTLIGCGVDNGLWKLNEMTDSSGQAWSTSYQLTDKGKQILSSINLKESGRGHEVTLKGPYRIEINGLSEPAPNIKRVAFHWFIDWDHAAPEMKACFPKFELTGAQTAQFDLSDPVTWHFASYVSPEDLAAPQNTGSALDKLR